MMSATATTDQQLSVGELAAMLRGTPYYQWPTLMQQLAQTPAGNQQALFDQASMLVQRDWDLAEVRVQLRQALTSAATEIIQAMTTLGGPASSDPMVAEDAEAHGELAGDADIRALTTYLSGAGQALRAAEALRPGAAA